MRDQEIIGLWEAYQQVHIQPQEEVEVVDDAPEKVEGGVDLFDYLLEYLVAEGYADTNKAALVIMANMSEEWKQSIIEMTDFEAGGGYAKIRKTGMNRDQVIALGKKNLAAKSSTSSKSGGSGSSDGSSGRPSGGITPGNYNINLSFGRPRQEPVSSLGPNDPARKPKGSPAPKGVTASDKFHAYNDSRDRADNIASWYGLNTNDPATKANLKAWADTNYRQNIAMASNDPNYDPTKVNYPEFKPSPRKR